MKKITLIFITFSGIYTGLAQKPAEKIDSINTKNEIKIDSVIEKSTASIRLYPNPAKNKVEIEVKGFNAGFVQVQLIDKSGKMVRNDKRMLYNGNETLVLMFSETPGLYYVIIKQGSKNLRAKLIIQ